MLSGAQRAAEHLTGFVRFIVKQTIRRKGVALTTAAKAALCICPPALMAGTVATVPPVKRAVHHLTAPRQAPKALRHAVAQRPAAPQAAARQQVDCDPAAGGPVPAVPLVTYADPIPDEPGGSSGGSVLSPAGVGPAVGGIAIGTPGGATPSTPVVPITPGAGAVPEPSLWLMMIAGVGSLGAALRRRRAIAAGQSGRRAGRTGRTVTAGGLLWSGSAAVEAGDMAATVAVKTTMASVAGKAMMCVCPAAIVAGSVATVPPLRQAVHAATLPAEPAASPPPAATAFQGAQPCTEPMTVPVAATAVGDFPAVVQTIPADSKDTAARPATPAAATDAAKIAVATPAASSSSKTETTI